MLDSDCACVDRLCKSIHSYLFSRYKTCREEPLRTQVFWVPDLRTFVRKLCYWSFLPPHVPVVSEWSSFSSFLEILGQEFKQLSGRDFIYRLKRKSDLDAACLVKARRDQSDKQPGSLDSLMEGEREEFATKGRQFIKSLIEILLKDVRLNADIVRGMASFDPVVLLVLPLEEALFCIKALYNSFKIRGWMTGSPEDVMRYDYVGFLEHFRCAYSNFKDSPEVFTDMVSS